MLQCTIKLFYRVLTSVFPIFKKSFGSVEHRERACPLWWIIWCTGSTLCQDPAISLRYGKGSHNSMNTNGETRLLKSEIFNHACGRTDEFTSVLLTQLPKDAKDTQVHFTYLEGDLDCCSEGGWSSFPRRSLIPRSSHSSKCRRWSMPFVKELFISLMWLATPHSSWF